VGEVIVGFTGTRKGMTEAQRASVTLLLKKLKSRGINQFWHGDEAHSDSEAARMAQRLNYLTVALPGPDPTTRGDFVSDERHDPMPYLRRNAVIAEACDVLIATPKPNSVEVLRGSGTWATVRYARGNGKTIYIVQPSGRIDREQYERRPGSLVDRVLEFDVKVGK
jgi:hypothetical protein